MSAGATLEITSKSSWARRLRISGVVISAVTAIGLLLAEARRSDDAVVDGLTVPADTLDFGVVWAQSAFQWQIPIHNQTSQPIAITNVRTSCHCTTVKPDTFTVSPGNVQQLTLSINLMPSTPTAAKQSVRDVNVLLWLDVNGGRRRTVELSVTGRARNPIRELPSIGFFGAAELVEGVPGEPRSLLLHLDDDIAAIDIDGHQFPGDVSVQPSGGSRSVRVVASPDSNMPSGPFAYVVPLMIRHRDGSRLPSCPLTIEGNVSSDLVTLPGSLRFSPTALGDKAVITFQVRSRTGRNIRLLKSDSSSGEITIERLDPQSSSIPTRLAKVMHTEGSDSDTIHLTIDHGGKRRFLSIPVASYGILRPRPSVEPVDQP